VLSHFPSDRAEATPKAPNQQAPLMATPPTPLCPPVWRSAQPHMLMPWQYHQPVPAPPQAAENGRREVLMAADPSDPGFLGEMGRLRAENADMARRLTRAAKDAVDKEEKAAAEVTRLKTALEEAVAKLENAEKSLEETKEAETQAEAQKNHQEARADHWKGQSVQFKAQLRQAEVNIKELKVMYDDQKGQLQKRAADRLRALRKAEGSLATATSVREELTRERTWATKAAAEACAAVGLFDARDADQKSLKSSLAALVESLKLTADSARAGLVSAGVKGCDEVASLALHDAVKAAFRALGQKREPPEAKDAGVQCANNYDVPVAEVAPKESVDVAVETEPTEKDANVVYWSDQYGTTAYRVPQGGAASAVWEEISPGEEGGWDTYDEEPEPVVANAEEDDTMRAVPADYVHGLPAAAVQDVLLSSGIIFDLDTFNMEADDLGGIFGQQSAVDEFVRGRRRSFEPTLTCVDEESSDLDGDQNEEAKEVKALAFYMMILPYLPGQSALTYSGQNSQSAAAAIYVSPTAARLLAEMDGRRRMSASAWRNLGNAVRANSRAFYRHSFILGMY